MDTPDSTTKRLGYIYLITNTVNGKQYVGKTLSSVELRWQQHIGSALRGEGFVLAAAMRKHGIEVFTIQTLDVVGDDDNLAARECYWIEHLNTLKPSGYNLTTGGEGAPGRVVSQVTRDKMSAQLRGKLMHPATPEMRSKISVALKGKPKSQEHNAKVSAALMGHSVSDEVKAKLRAAKLGKKRGPHSDEHRARISAANKGRTLSEKGLAAINTPESIAKRAATNRMRHEEKRRARETLHQLKLWD